MTDSTGTILTIAMMACIAAPFVGFLVLLYWLMIGSRLPPNVKRLREKRDIAGLKKALNYLNLSRDFWNVRRAAVQALGELSLMPGDTAIATQAVEALLDALHGRVRQIDSRKISFSDNPYTAGKIPLAKYNAFCLRIEQVRELAAKTLGEIGTQTQDATLRSRITEELIAVLEKDRNSQELRNTVASVLEAMTGQGFGVDYERWSTWWREYHQ
jgi:HEAT repeat protein